MNINIKGKNFVDNFGRRVMLRGVNLGGSSKVPYTPDGATYIREGFFDHRNVSFVGRPFPLEQADEHLGRLREWGFNFLRLLVTWEAIEHTGPNIFDEAYLDYVLEVVKAAEKFGFNLFIDPHQDVWSRFSGGDGAPGWTLEAVGFDITKFAETGAAIVHATHDGPFPHLIWSTNAGKLACTTMFSLFFGGNDFAPHTKVDGEPVQEYLQRHYIEAIYQLAMRLKDQPNVLGYGTINEPSRGYIGWHDLTSPDGLLTMGDAPTPFQSMLLGDGIPQEVAIFGLRMAGVKHLGYRKLNETGVRAWKDGYPCVWRQNGIWDTDASGTPRLLRPEYFTQVNGRPVDFSRDYYRPFVNRFATSIRNIHPDALIFLETQLDTPICNWNDQDAHRIVYAPHWYDGYIMAMNTYTAFLGIDSLHRKLVVGQPAIRRSYRRQLESLKKSAAHELGGVPCILGEFGIPFDMQGKHAYRSGDFRLQVNALQRSIQAAEDNLLDYALWNYTSDNNNRHGDLWNQEDLSIYSPDQRTNPRDINSGGRALEAVVRPFPMATPGELVKSTFNPRTRVFELIFHHDPALSDPSLVFVPNFQYPHGYSVRVSDGRYEIHRSSQTLLYWPDPGRKVHKLRIKP